MKVRDREYLRKTLEHTGLSYREIAALAGVSHATLANLARPDGRDGCSEKSARGISRAVGADMRLLFLSPPYVTVAQQDEKDVQSKDLRESK